MDSYEKGLSRSRGGPKSQEGQSTHIPLFKFLWQANPLTTGSKDTVAKFLKEIQIFHLLSDVELSILTKYLHLRSFAPSELIFEQGDPGMGFYMIYSGHVEIVARDDLNHVKGDELEDFDLKKGHHERHIVLLERLDYFGEMAILQESGVRTASALAKTETSLLSIFRPDIEEMVNEHPNVGTKFLQCISLIVANRFASLTKEMKVLKYRLKKYEAEHDLESS